ncbi:MAG: hypothetical protein K6C14_02805 [Eubacterium sp.]|nr:hypothetical protein [Eubacterium sp.]
MYSFSSLALSLQYALCVLLFIAGTLQFALVIYKYVSTRSAKYCLTDGALFTALVVFLAYLSSSAASDGSAARYVNIPFAAVLLLSIGVAAYAAVQSRREYVKNKNRLTPSSIKQALDNLNSGICFADEKGRIILINRVMSELAFSASGVYPCTLTELRAALPSHEYKTASGKIWRITTDALRADTLKGFTQTTAADVTQLYEANAAIERENAELKKTNEEIRVMLERLSERIREQESLNLKTQIHNDIGTSLIAITKIMDGGSAGDMEYQLAQLKTAVGYFADNRVDKRLSTLDEAREKAESMGVELIVESAEKLSEKQERLITAAADESITNCIKHAKATKLFVKIIGGGDTVTARFTDNGDVPKNGITEGGGLSLLRRKTESAGGKMNVYSSPVFMLEIILPREM